jgi:hypothetical protein
MNKTPNAMTRYPRVNPWPSPWGRHETSILLWELGVFTYLSLGLVSAQPINSPALAITGATVVAAAKVALDERLYRKRRPRMRLSLKRVEAAASHLMRTGIMWRDIPAAQPTQMWASISDLARGLAARPSWTPYEATQIREGIERLLLGFEAAVGRHVPALPPAALDRVDEIWIMLDDAAERLLRVTDASNDLITASFQAADLTDVRRIRDGLVDGMLDQLRLAVVDWEWLVGAADA